MDGWIGNTLKTAITTRALVVLITDVTSPCLSYRLCTYVATILPFKSVKSPKTDLFPHCLLLPLFAQFKRTHLSKIPIATHRSKIGSYLSSSGRAWCIQLKRMQQHESHSLGEEQNEFKIPLYFFDMLWTHFKIAPATLLIFSFVIVAVIFIRNSETIEIQCFACMVFVMKWE